MTRLMELGLDDEDCLDHYIDMLDHHWVSVVVDRPGGKYEAELWTPATPVSYLSQLI